MWDPDLEKSISSIVGSVSHGELHDASSAESPELPALGFRVLPKTRNM